jgi:hypothetical protein
MKMETVEAATEVWRFDWNRSQNFPPNDENDQSVRKSYILRELNVSKER